MFKFFVKDFLLKTKRYVTENWGSPFIVSFMLLLIVASAFLAIGFEFLANDVAVYAYYSLVVGVVLQLVCFLKHGKTEGSAN